MTACAPFSLDQWVDDSRTAESISGEVAGANTYKQAFRFGHTDQRPHLQSCPDNAAGQQIGSSRRASIQWLGPSSAHGSSNATAFRCSASCMQIMPGGFPSYRPLSKLTPYRYLPHTTMYSAAPHASVVMSPSSWYTG